MENLSLEIVVTPAGALVAGKTAHGEGRVELTEEWIAALTAAEKLEVHYLVTEEIDARGFYHGRLGTQLRYRGDGEYQTSHIEQATEISLDEALRLIRARIEAMPGLIEESQVKVQRAKEERVEAEAVWAALPPDEFTSHVARFRVRPSCGSSLSYGSLPTVHLVAGELLERAQREWDEMEARLEAEQERKAQIEAEQAVQAKEAEEALIARYPELAGRWKEGLLPEQELIDVARGDLFEPLARFSRFERLRGTDLDDLDMDGRCDAAGYHVRIKFAVDDGGKCGLTDDEYQELQAIREICARMPRAHLQLRTHTVECECSRLSRVSVLITVDWAGRRLSREYGLSK